MSTARLPTVRARGGHSVPVGIGNWSQVSPVQWIQVKQVWTCRVGGYLYSKVQSIMGNGHMGPPCEQTETLLKTLPSLNFIDGLTDYSFRLFS